MYIHDKNQGFPLFGAYQVDSVICSEPAPGSDISSLYYVFRPGFAYFFTTSSTAPLNVPMETESTDYPSATVDQTDFSVLEFPELFVSSKNITKYSLDLGTLYLIDNDLWLYKVNGLAHGGVPTIYHLQKISNEEFENIFGVGNADFNSMEQEWPENNKN